MSVGKVISALTGNILGTGPAKGGKTTPIARLSQIELAKEHTLPKTGPTDPLAFSTLAYPSDVVNDPQGGHYMLFYVNVPSTTKYPYQSPSGVPIGGVEYATAKEDVNEPQFGLSIKKGEDYAVRAYSGKPSYQEKLNIKTGTVPNANVNKLFQNKQPSKVGIRKAMADSGARGQTQRIADSIAIYLPPQVQDNYSVTYNNTETGLLGFIAAGGGSIVDAYMRGDYQELARRGLDTGRGVLEEVLKNLGTQVLELTTQAEGGYELFNKVLGRGLNPFMEVLFSGVQLRQFTYNFDFMPRNKEEQETVKKIITMFKFHAAPELRGNNMFMGLPSEFDIHYMYQPPVGDAFENGGPDGYYNKIATCVLNNVTTNYTPSGVRSHEDGSPVKITMSLSFTEAEMITKDHVDVGY